MASDMRLNDKPIAKDGAYIYAEAADGSQVKISKADLAAVVAGIIRDYNWSAILGVKESTFVEYDFNEVSKAGRYVVRPSATNTPVPTWGYMEVSGNGNDVCQTFISLSGVPSMFFRAKMSGGDWSEWKQLQSV